MGGACISALRAEESWQGLRVRHVDGREGSEAEEDVAGSQEDDADESDSDDPLCAAWRRAEEGGTLPTAITWPAPPTPPPPGPASPPPATSPATSTTRT